MRRRWCQLEASGFRNKGCMSSYNSESSGSQDDSVQLPGNIFELTFEKSSYWGRLEQGRFDRRYL